jgi:RNA polymerase sigma-19 factor, ECF subfamily
MPKLKVVAPNASPADESGVGTVVHLFRSNARRVSDFLAYRLRNREDGQDAAQEVFLKLWKRESEGQLRAQATAYLNSAMHSIAIDIDRARASRGAGHHVAIDDVPLATGDLPIDEAQFWRDAVLRLVEVLKELPELTQRIFALYHFEGMDHKTIAGELGLTQRTVERHMARALEHCAPRMKDFIG